MSNRYVVTIEFMDPVLEKRNSHVYICDGPYSSALLESALKNRGLIFMEGQLPIRIDNVTRGALPE